MRQRSLAPTNKVLAGSLGAAIASIIVWVLEANGITVPPEAQTGITTIGAFGVGYLVPPRASDLQ